MAPPDPFRAIARIHESARKVQAADNAASTARAELGRRIERARASGLPLVMLAEAAGVSRKHTYRLMQMGRAR